MATFSAAPLANGSVQLTCGGVADSATQVVIQCTTTGFFIYNGAYNNSSLTVVDNNPYWPSDSYSATFKTAAGGVIGTLTAGTPIGWTAGNAYFEYSGPYAGVWWTAMSNTNGQYSFSNVTIIYRINGGAWTSYGTTWGNSGDTGASAVYAGYSATVEWQVVWHMSSGWQGSSLPSGTTGPAPPPAPYPATNAIVTSDDDNNTVALAWTASSGGASGYYVYRTQPGGSMTYVNSTTGTTYTDTAAGSGRPIIYDILAYNSGAGGTTTASSYAEVYTKSRVTKTATEYWTALAQTLKAEGLVWLIKTIINNPRGLLWTVYNARLTADGAPAVVGIAGNLTDVDEDPYVDDGVWAAGTGGNVDFRVTFANPDSIHMSNPTGRQQFRVLVRTP